ncbi:MAG: tetratricopeptide repeat protein [Pirellulaceae bacterium]
MNAEELFLAALERQTTAERKAFLDGVCAQDPSLREQVEALLRSHEAVGSFLVSPLFEGAETVIQPALERPGSNIGPYKLLEEIGHGGMGVVYLAEQKEPVKRRVALKIIKPGMDTRQVIARFEAERQALAMMDHPNIARVLDAGATETGRPYFVMELVKGMPLTEYCDQQRLTARQRLELFVPVCHAIQHAHQKGIIHRDLKPSNILVALFDGRPVPKVIDFGVSKAISQTLTEKTMFTGLGQIVGTLEYMSPEQAQVNQLDVDTRTDVYSLGVLLYELLTGEMPFDRQRLRSAAFDEMLRIIREEEPPRPSTRLSSSAALPSIAANRQTEPQKLSGMIRGDLDWIVMKAMEKERERRYETANGMAADIQHYLNDEPVTASPPSAIYRFRKFSRRNKAGFVLTAAGTLAILLVVASIGWAIRDRSAQRTEAARQVRERQLRIDTQVALYIEDVERLLRTEQWEDAQTALVRAQVAMANEDCSEDLRDKVRRIALDLKMVARLQDILLRASDVRGVELDREGTCREYANAFLEYGIDFAATTPDEAVTVLRTRQLILPALVVGLDDWARWRRRDDADEARFLTEVAVDLDSDPWRKRWRRAGIDADESELMKLADSSEVFGQPPIMICLATHVLERNDQPEKALEILNSALEQHPGDFWLHWAVANNSGKCHPPRREDAVCHWKIARVLRPEAIAVWNHLGIALRAHGKLDEAIACYRKAIELDPKCVAAHLNLGNILLDQGKLDEAFVCYRKALEVDPNFAPTHLEHGKALSRQGRLDEAMASFRKALELDPNLALAHINVGKTLEEQEKLDEAIDCYRYAIEVDPEYAGGYSALGVLMGKQGKSEEAAKYCRKAVELDPKSAPLHSNLGHALRDQGMVNEAIDCYRKALELDPKHVPAQYNLGLALRDQGKLDEAAEHFRKSMELDPNSARYCIDLGGTLNNLANRDMAAQRFDEARTRLLSAIDLEKRAMALAPGDPEALKFLQIHYSNLLKAAAGLQDQELAMEARRGLAELARNDRQSAALDERISAVLAGESANDAAELLAFGFRAYKLQKFALAARFYGEALDREPALAESRQAQHAYNAACCAALAASNQGIDDLPTDYTARMNLRQLALVWLQAELDRWRKFLDSATAEQRQMLAATLEHWQTDQDLTGIRETNELSKLPEAERSAWDAFWSQVREFHTTVSTEPPGENAP